MTLPPIMQGMVNYDMHGQYQTDTFPSGTSRVYVGGNYYGPTGYALIAPGGFYADTPGGWSTSVVNQDDVAPSALVQGF